MTLTRSFIENVLRKMVREGRLSDASNEEIIERLFDPKFAPKSLSQLRTEAKIMGIKAGRTKEETQRRIEQQQRGELDPTLLAPEEKITLRKPRKYHLQTECGICEENRRLIVLDCGHGYCHECLSQWILPKISTSEHLCCPNPHCHAPILQLSTLITQKIARMKLANMFSDGQTVFPCLCGGIVFGSQCGRCKTDYCGTCYRHWHHGPCDPKVLESLNISRFPGVKPCPTCGMTILKDGGCDHMHCKMCGTHFSWQFVDTDEKVWNFNPFAVDITGISFVRNRIDEALATEERKIEKELMEGVNRILFVDALIQYSKIDPLGISIARNSETAKIYREFSLYWEKEAKPRLYP